MPESSLTLCSVLQLRGCQDIVGLNYQS